MFVVPIAVGVFGRTAVAWVLLVAGVLGAITLVAALWQRAFVRRFPEIEFTPSHVSFPASVIADATARLAPDDYAAFIVRPLLVEDERDIYGQLWLYSGPGGHVERVAVELGYELEDDPATRPEVAGLEGGGWVVSKWEPGGWLLMEPPASLDTAELLSRVVRVLESLYGLDPESRWTVRAFA